MGAKLTAAACRAGRALLGWTVRDLMREAEVSPNTVTGFEGGGPIRPATEAKIIEAFARHGVEITNGNGTGARLIFPAKAKGSYRVLEMKAGGGFVVRFTPDGYGAPSDTGGFSTEAEAQAWADDRAND
jgi:hypothetical protein